MQKYIFLLPLYNDWESLTLLLTKINEEIKSKNKIADILVINDCSTVLTPTFFSLSNINKINILATQNTSMNTCGHLWTLVTQQ